MRVNVLDFGAASDGSALAHDAVNAAVEYCASKGGGVVCVPAGVYRCGTIVMRSGVMIELEHGARIAGSGDLSVYRGPVNAEGRAFRPWYRALILAEGVTDAGICGLGTIDGGAVRDPEGEEHMRGPHTVVTSDCSRLTFRDFSVIDSGNYAFLILDSDDVSFDRLSISGGWDGVHVRGRAGRDCRDITISNCRFQTGDDCIAGRYWRNFGVYGCRINSSCNGLRLIGPAVGLTVSGCCFFGPGRFPHITQNRYNMLAGILLQPGSWDDTKGDLDKVMICGNVMSDVECAFAVYIKPGNTCGTISVENLKAVGVYSQACSVESWAELPAGCVTMRDVAVDCTAAAALLEQVSADTPPHLGIRALPAWGFYGRNIDSVILDNVRFSMPCEDARPCIGLRDVKNDRRRLCGDM